MQEGRRAITFSFKPFKYLNGMIPLNTTFFKYGHSFQQIAREGNVALYERTFEDRNICYELIIVRSTKEQLLPSGKVKPAGELYPSSDAFGKFGWSLIKHTEEKAIERFQELVKKEQSKSNTKKAA